jgi:hypothetical protein
MSQSNETSPDTAESRVAAPPPCSAFVVLRLTDLKLLKCRDRGELTDAVSNLKKRQIGFVVLRWHDGAQTYVQPELHE